MKKAFITFVLFLNIMAIAALLFSYLAIYIPPDKFWPTAIFGLAYPFLAMANILFIVFWIFVKPRNLLFSMFALLLGFGFLKRYFQLFGDSTDKNGIKVVSYNVMLFGGEKGSSQRSNANRIISFLDQQNADIICLQDAQLGRNNAFNAANAVKQLKTIEHYHFGRASVTFGVVTFTRYPIIKMGEIRTKNSNNIAIFTDVLIGKDTVRIFNVHMQSYKIDPRKYGIIDSPGITEEEDLRELREIGGKLKRAFQFRAGQAREIRKYIEETPYPVIICGDFNDTPVSYAYQRLRGDRNDAFVESGRGMGRTYIGKLPSFRIDNILCSDDFKAYNFKTSSDFRMSDHLPISCTLIMK